LLLLSLIKIERYQFKKLIFSNNSTHTHTHTQFSIANAILFRKTQKYLEQFSKNNEND